MQFTLHGPDIPEALLEAHEEGRVVFFCGAGISYGAGLPDFKGLVDAVRQEIGDEATAVEQSFLDAGRYDSALGYLERKLPKRETMRRAVAKVLKPDLSRSDATATHRALIDLARVNAGDRPVHLVTTNFDRVFESFVDDGGHGINRYAAPFLPIPKDSAWNGIVYLHGLLPAVDDIDALRKLVMTSGDFGRAYLSERWAARFVSEMLRNYVVCFVGYSVADPVMRYLLDAIDADRAEGESINAVYMFLPEGEIGSRGLDRNESIVGIPYSESDGHKVLHESLVEWARIYRKGLNGRAELVDRLSQIDPDKMPDDGYQGRMIWALSDKSGCTARRFAEMEPAPPIGWLDVFAQKKIPRIEDDERHSDVDLLAGATDYMGVDIRQKQLFRWMSRYLNNPHLIRFVLENGAHDEFRRFVESQLDRVELLIASGDQEKIRVERLASPDIIPDEFAIRIWKLILAKMVAMPIYYGFDRTYSLADRIVRNHLDYLTLVEIERYLTPVLRVHTTWMDGTNRKSADQNLQNTNNRNNFWWTFALRHEESHYYAQEIRDKLKGSLVQVFDVVQHALDTALSAAWFLDSKLEDEGALFFDVPSIEGHPQNEMVMRDWRIVVDVVRDSWLELAKTDRARATGVFYKWRDSPYQLYKRLALFAAKHFDVIEPSEWVEVLLRDNGRILWSHYMQREVCRLLATASVKLTKRDLGRLISAIEKGPKLSWSRRASSRSTIEENGLCDRAIWLRLKKLEVAGCRLSASAQKLLATLSEKYSLKLLPDEQEEFAFWSWVSYGDEDENDEEGESVPEDVEQLVAWLKKDAVRERPMCRDRKDDWKRICHDFPMRVESALQLAVKRGIWNSRRFNEALRVWRGPTLAASASELLAQVLPMADDSCFDSIAAELCQWSEEVAKKNQIPTGLQMMIWRRLVDSNVGSGNADQMNQDGFDAISAAINHPIGIFVSALFDSCFGKTVQKGEGIKEPYRSTFANICSSNDSRMRYGRVILASRLITLYYADADWVRKYVLGRMSWGEDLYEARDAWEGFLWVNTIHTPLMNDLKRQTIETADHLNLFREGRQSRYCSLITSMAIFRTPGFSVLDYKKVFRRFDAKLLKTAAETLVDMLRKRQPQKGDVDGERRDAGAYWREDIRPFIHDVWPKDVKLCTTEIRQAFALIAIYSGDEFPNAIKELDWAWGPLDDLAYVLHAMKRTGCISRHPEEALRFLVMLVRRMKHGPWRLGECLEEIRKANGELVGDLDYQRLKEMLEKSSVCY